MPSALPILWRQIFNACLLRMGLFASTPFIGSGRNNFSHVSNFFSRLLCRNPNQPVQLSAKVCSEPLHSLSRTGARVCLDSMQSVRGSAPRIAPFVPGFLRFSSLPHSPISPQ
jgi:hypothetical protein